MTNSDLTMQLQADLGGFEVIRPDMRESVAKYLSQSLSNASARSTALGAALLAGAAIKLFGWDLNDPKSLAQVNTKGEKTFKPQLPDEQRETRWRGWKRAVDRSQGWTEEYDSE